MPANLPRLRALALLGSVLALSACGSRDGDDTLPSLTTPRLPPDGGPADPRLTGRYRFVAEAAQTEIAAGEWLLVLARGRYRIVNPSGGEWRGTYRTRDEEITFSGSPCPATRGLYRWRIGDRLELEARGDRCANRLAALGAEPWDPAPPGSGAP